MTSWLRWLCFCLFAVSSLAHAAGQIPEATGLLVDQTGVLSDGDRQALTSRLRGIRDSGRAQVAILVSTGTRGEPLSDYTLRVAEKWQLGRAGRDDGLLIVVIPSANAARIEVGSGLEGSIPEALVSRWLAEMLPVMSNQDLAAVLNRLLDRVEGVLPATAPLAPAASTEPVKGFFADHPEWTVPFVLVVFSLFAVFPLFFGRWGAVASGPLLACFLGGAAWSLWSSQAAGLAAAAIALPLPFLWGLNWWDSKDLAPWQRYARTLGNLVAVAAFFSVITIFVGGGLSAMEVGDGIWIGLGCAALLATGLAVVLFPGRPARVLGRVLASAMLFVFILTVAWIALYPLVPYPGAVSASVAGAITALVAFAFYLESRGNARGSRWCFVLMLVVVVPLGGLALVRSVTMGFG